MSHWDETPLPIRIQGAAAVHPNGRLAPMEFAPGLAPADLMGYACPDLPPEGLIPANVGRRLGRAQLLGLSAACQAAGGCRPLPGGEDASVYVGTGQGSIADTVAFIENMILLEEREPKPAKFINSVHNAVAATVAIQLGLKGKNLTIVQDAASFDLAAQRAAADLAAGRTRRALVVGVDELGPYPTAAGYHFGWWRSPSRPLAPLEEPSPAPSGSLPGEGAGAVLLGRAEGASEELPGVRLGALRVERLAPRDLARLDAAAEVAFLEGVAASAGGSLEQADCVIFGANGDAREDARYRSVAEALRARSPRLAVAVFKHLCGEFCTASAIGLGLAVELARGARPPLRVLPPHGEDVLDRARRVLVYNLYETGFHSAYWVAATHDASRHPERHENRRLG